MNIRFFLVLLMLSLASSPSTAKDIQVKTFAYSKALDLESNRLVSLSLDLYLPDTPTGALRPVAIFAHGLGGDKYSPMATYWCNEQFAARGWACASINYRTSRAGGPGLAQKAALSDMLAAIRWVHANAEQNRLDPDRIVAIGVSGGAIISLGAGIAGNNSDSSFFNDPAMNQSNKTASSTLSYSIGISGQIDPEIRKEFLDKEDPPALMYNGGKDTIVPYSKAVNTFEALRAAGVRVKFMPFPDAAHSLGQYKEKIAGDIWASLRELDQAGRKTH